jgi:hypothetical protein
MIGDTFLYLVVQIFISIWLWSILSFIKQFSFGTCIYNCRPSWYEAINCDYFVDSKLNNGCDKARKLHMDILKTMYNQNDYSIEKWKLCITKMIIVLKNENSTFVYFMFLATLYEERFYFISCINMDNERFFYIGHFLA